MNSRDIAEHIINLIEKRKKVYNKNVKSFEFMIIDLISIDRINDGIVGLNWNR